MNSSEIKGRDNIIRYMLGGKALVTFYNDKTGKGFNYAIKKPNRSRSVWYVKPASNPYDTVATIKLDNGIISMNQDKKLHPSPFDKLQEGFKWVWDRVIADTLPENIHILHNGRCGACGRELTDPNSVLTGIGPVCGGRSKIFDNLFKTNTNGES